MDPIFRHGQAYTAAMIGDQQAQWSSDAYIKGSMTSMLKKLTNTCGRMPLKYLQGRKCRPVWEESPGQLHEIRIIPRGTVSGMLSTKGTGIQDARICIWRLCSFPGCTRACKTADYKALKKRSQNYRNVFDVSTGYVRGRYADGRDWTFHSEFKSKLYLRRNTFSYTWYVASRWFPDWWSSWQARKAYLKKLDDFFNGGWYWHAMRQISRLRSCLPWPVTQQEHNTWLIDQLGRVWYWPGGLSGNWRCRTDVGMACFFNARLLSRVSRFRRIYSTSLHFEEISIPTPEENF